MFSEEQDYADIQERDDFLEEESSLPGRQIPVDWNEGGDSCRNSTSGKSIIVAAPLPQ